MRWPILFSQKPRKRAGFPLRSVTVVVVDDLTENVAAAHLSMALGTRFGNRNLLFETLMWARCVEESDVLAHHAS